MLGQVFMDDMDTEMCGDFFDHIDDLLDFSNEEDIGGGIDTVGLDGCWPTAPDDLALSGSSLSVNGSGNSQSLEDDLAAELSVPCEDIAQLEWLSNFVEDSFSAGSVDLDKDANTHFQTSSPVSVLESSSCSGKPMPRSPDRVVPGRARSKRPRPPSFSSRTVPSDTISDPEFTESQTPKEKKQKQQQAQPGARKCMHCEIQKTPQWRMGPMGPKTLCNACGVRYKSGRLYPEYRPAASPTFVAKLHSNSHKRVLEMRIHSGLKDPAPTPKFVRKTSHLLDCN